MSTNTPAFIEALTGDAESVLRYRAIDDNKQRKLDPHEFEGPYTHARKHIARYQEEGYGIFYFLNEIPRHLQDYATDKDVMRVRAIPADFDTGIPDNYEWHTPPDLIVRTSVVDGIQKGQALWLGEVPLDQFKPICRRIIAYYKSDPAVCNLSRILRLPGTMHLKGEPQLVTWSRYGKGA